MKGKNRFFQGDIMYLGYSVAFVPYARAQRASGKSQWTFVKRLKYFQDMIVASSDLIPRSATIIGAVLSILGVATSSLLLIRLLSKESAYSDSLPEVGISLLMVIAGLIIFLLGQIGEYLWRIHEEIVDRPIFLVDQMVEKPSE
jgi:dolichol-phosphate mannosyltransferase